MKTSDAPVTTQDFAGRLIGREREQTALGVVLTRMLEGHGSVVLISGEAGIGKTTLVEYLCREAARQNAIVFSGHCYDLTVTPPYGPWIEIAYQYEAEEGWPTLPAFFHSRDALEALGGQQALFDQAWEFYASLTTIRPLILVFEDLQWADEPTLELIRFVGRQAGTRRLLLIGTYRDDEILVHHPLYRTIPLLVRESRAMRVKLNRFDRIDTGELIEERYDLTGDDLERLLTYLLGRSEGNPFFIEELLLSLENEGILRIERSRWVLGDLSSVPLPSLVRQVVESRLHKLNEQTRRILMFGAVIGESIPLDLWRSVTTLTESEFAKSLVPAIEEHILVEDSSPDRLRFSHALIQATLYEEVVLPQRRLWHRVAGEAMVQTASPDPSLIADHFRRAGDRRAVEWLVRAGRRAQRLYAWRVAVERFQDALALLDEDESRVIERGWICYRLGRVLCFRDPVQSRNYLEDAVRIGENTGNELLSACATTELGHRYGLDGEYQPALEFMGHGLEAFDRLLGQRADPTEGQPTPESLKRAMEELRGKRIIWVAAVESFDTAMDLAHEALALLVNDQTTGDTIWNDSISANGTANIYSALGLCHASVGKVDEARDAFSRARQLHRNPFALVLTIDAEFLMVTVPYLLDQPALLEQQVDEVSRCLATSVEDGIAADGVYSFARAELSLIHGIDWANTMRVLDRARTAESDAVWRTQAFGVLGKLARYRGEPELAWSQVRSVFPRGAAINPGETQIFTSTEVIVLAAELSMDVADLTEAHVWLQCYDHWLDRPGIVRGRAAQELLWARYHELDGNLSLARKHAEQSLAVATNPRQPLALIEAYRFLGRLKLEAGNFPEAEMYLNEAVSLSDACHARYELALTLLVVARLRARKGRIDDVTAFLNEVRTICTPLDARPALAEADEIMASLEVTGTGVFGNIDLTPREIEVLRLVARGMTDAEVAEELFISPRTIGQHLHNVYNKLGVSSRVAATRFAIEHNLV